MPEPTPESYIIRALYLANKLTLQQSRTFSLKVYEDENFIYPTTPTIDNTYELLDENNISYINAVIVFENTTFDRMMTEFGHSNRRDDAIKFKINEVEYLIITEN
jgi:hypothetical protein